jgi:hypothetical protein
MDIDDAFAAVARCAEIHPVLVHRRTAPAHLIEQGEQGTAERHELVDPCRRLPVPLKKSPRDIARRIAVGPR